MRAETINKLCCPFDREELELKVITRGINNDILEGVLTCKTCKRYYPIISGVPIMSPDEYREKSLEQPLIEKWKPELLGQTTNRFRLPDGKE